MKNFSVRGQNNQTIKVKANSYDEAREIAFKKIDVKSTTKKKARNKVKTSKQATKAKLSHKE